MLQVLVSNVLSHAMGQPLEASYDGYTSCPIATGRHKAMLCEFGFSNVLHESFPWDQSRDEGWRGRVHSMLLTTVFPFVYWNMMLKGRWFGPTGPFEPKSALI